MRAKYIIIAIFIFVGLFSLPRVELWEISAQGLFDKTETNASLGIRASLLPDQKSVYLLWEPSDRDKEVIIARSSSIIDTPEKLYVADSLGRFSAKSKTSVTNYYDYNLKPGTYYYAVVPVDDVKSRSVKLKGNQNYTTQAIIVKKGSTNTSQDNVVPSSDSNQSQTVGAIILKAEKNNIRVNWVPPWNAVPGKTIYSIYRSTKPLSTMEEMKEADKLSELPHPINTYLDQNLEKSQTLYYGVSVKDEKREEILPLEKGKSFVRIFFIKDKDGRSEAVRDTEPTEVQKTTTGEDKIPEKFTVLGFGYEREGKGAVLKWVPPKNADETTQYTLYAATNSFDGGVNSFVGGSVLKVGTLTHPKTSLKIKEIKPVDSLYFAITVKKAGVPENFDLREGESFFRYQFDKNIVPTVAKNETTPEKQKDPTNESDKEKKNSDLKDPANTPKLGKKDEDSETKKENSENVTKDTVEYSDIQEFQDINIDVSTSKNLDHILRNSYSKKRFEIAAFQLERYAIRETNSKLKGKALFYAGISRYRTGEYRKALDHFLSEESSEFNSRRTNFWKNQTLAKLGRGRR